MMGLPEKLLELIFQMSHLKVVNHFSFWQNITFLNN